MTWRNTGEWNRWANSPMVIFAVLAHGPQGGKITQDQAPPIEQMKHLKGLVKGEFGIGKDSDGPCHFPDDLFVLRGDLQEMGFQAIDIRVDMHIHTIDVAKTGEDPVLVEGIILDHPHLSPDVIEPGTGPGADEPVNGSVDVDIHSRCQEVQTPPGWGLLS